MSAMDSNADIQRLLQIMARLRQPEGGCPWDLQQSFASIAPYTVEEAYEVADAIERDDMPALRDELGDLLFQVVFHSQLAAERGSFDFAAVVSAICGKMLRRHPHVFADASIKDADAQSASWEQIKQAERQARRQSSVLDDVPLALPALSRANKLGKRAAQVGFEWSDVRGALEKLQEELGEFQEEMDQHLAAGDAADNRERLAAEIGDVLFCVVNVCRYLRIDPELALKQTNGRFEQRFRYIEQRLAEQGSSPQQASLDTMDALWDEAKAVAAGKTRDDI